MRMRLALLLPAPILLVAAITTLPSLQGCQKCQGAACNQPDASLPSTACIPDQSFSVATARPLTPGTAVTETICPILDDDYWSFSTADLELAEVLLTREAVISGIDLAVTILDAQGLSVGGATDTDGSDGPTNLRSVVRLQKNASYSAKVADVGGDEADPSAPYSLTINLFADPDTHEPNDTPQTATAADTGAAGNEGYLSTTGDVDVWTVQATDGQIMRFSLSVPEASLSSPVATITGPDGVVVYTSPALPAAATGGARTVTANVALKSAGTFRATVADPDEGADFRTAEGRYTLKMELISDPDQDEVSGTRNDELNTPVKVNNPSSAATRRPAISTVGDEDNYMVVINPADAQGGRKILEVRVQVAAGTALPAFHPVLSIWDQVIWIEGNASGNCANQVANNGGYLCGKPCSTGSSCAGGRGGDQQECIPADPAQPTVDRYCAEPRLMRRLTVRTDGSIDSSVRYPLRSGRNPIVTLADELNDSYDERAFTLTMQIVDDPDTHEPDDLPQVLLAIGGGDGASVRSQDLRHFPHSSIGPSDLGPELCSFTVDAGVPDGSVPPPCTGRVDGGTSLNSMIDCSGYDETTSEVTGYLAYEGDRDYWRFEVPYGFYNIDVEYTFDPAGTATTPVELAVFVYVANAGGFTGDSPLRGSFVLTERQDSVNANLDCQFDTDCPDDQECRIREGMGICRKNTGENTTTSCSSDGQCASDERCRPNGPTGGVCRGRCASNLECPNGGLCIEQKCFADTDSNPGTNGMQTFGPANGQCLYAHQCNSRPLFVEVVDNGLNDSDRTTPYTLRVHLRCGCPGVCGQYCTEPQINCERGD